MLSYSAAQGRFKKGTQACEAKAQILRPEEIDKISLVDLLNSIGLQKCSKVSLSGLHKTSVMELESEPRHTCPTAAGDLQGQFDSPEWKQARHFLYISLRDHLLFLYLTWLWPGTMPSSRQQNKSQSANCLKNLCKWIMKNTAQTSSLWEDTESNFSWKQNHHFHWHSLFLPLSFLNPSIQCKKMMQNHYLDS